MELRSRLGAAARAKAEAEYSLAAYRRRLQRAFEMVAAARRAPVLRGDISVNLAETGVIQPETMVLVKSKVSGKVRRLGVNEGELVQQGDRLAIVEPDMAQARTVASLSLIHISEPTRPY